MTDQSTLTQYRYRPEAGLPDHGDPAFSVGDTVGDGLRDQQKRDSEFLL